METVGWVVIYFVALTFGTAIVIGCILFWLALFVQVYVQLDAQLSRRNAKKMQVVLRDIEKTRRELKQKQQEEKQKVIADQLNEIG